MKWSAAIRRAAALRGEHPMIYCEDERIGWAELVRRVQSASAALAAHGIAPGDRFAVLLPNGIDITAMFLAAMWSGAAIVPLNTRWSHDELTYAIEDCGARLLITGAPFTAAGLDAARASGAAAIDVDAERTALFHRADAQTAATEIARDALLAIFYTGGTTGRSKGVMLSHDNVAYNGLAALAEGLFGANETFLHVSPVFHIAGALGLFGTLLSAARSVIVPRFDPGIVLRLLERERCTQTLLVPTMIQMVLDHPDFAGTELSHVRNVLHGAAPIADALLDRAMRGFPNAAFTNLYGMTELSPCATVLHSRDYATPATRHRAGAAGRAIVGTEIRIVGIDGGPVPQGEVGEIAVAGPGVMQGYWKRPAETAEAIRDGWMHTGDGGYLDEDGFVYLVDRLKDMIISGGENVYSVEVETVLARHPAVQQCAVIGIADPQWGERVHAVVRLHDGVKSAEPSLEDWCREHLTSFKRPRSYDFRQEPLPMSGAGKLLKSELRKQYQNL